MASRIENFTIIPNELPATSDTAQRVTDIPEKFILSRSDAEVAAAINRLTLNVKAIKSDLKVLGLTGIITVDDLRGFVVLNGAELATLNDLLAGNILSRLQALETP